MLCPVPLDGWLLASIVFWIVAASASLLRSTELRGLDPVDLLMPVTAGAMAIALALCIRAMFGRISIRLVLLFSMTLTIGIALTILTGDRFSSPLPFALDPQSEYRLLLEDFERPKSEYFKSHGFVAGSTLLFVLVGFAGVFAIRRFSISMNWLQSCSSLLRKYRIRLMIAFVAIMLPAVVLRNVFDPNLKSAPFFVAGFSALVILVGGLTMLRVAMHLISKRRRLLAMLFVGGGVAAVAAIALVVHLDMIAGERGFLQTIGTTCAYIIAPVIFMLTLMTAVFWPRHKNVGGERNAGRSGRRFSLWTIVITCLTIAAVSESMRYAPRVVAAAFVDSEEDFIAGDWIETARQSRRVQIESGGSAGIGTKWGQNAVYVRITDQGDADCLRGVVTQKVPGVSLLLIENLQPFVDTSPLSSWGLPVSIERGQITSEQLSHLSQNSPTLSISGVRLPPTNEHGASFDLLITNQPENFERLPEFLDGYATSISLRGTQTTCATSRRFDLIEMAWSELRLQLTWQLA